MSQLRFHEALLVQRLSKMPVVSILVFSLCCATRQLNAFEQFAEHFSPESRDSARNIIDQLWDTIDDNTSARRNWQADLEQIMNLLPEEQDHWAPLHVYADHALSSLAYTIRCLLKPDAQEAAWSARRAYEAADQAAIRDLDIQIGTTDSEVRISAHPIVKRELKRQESDLQLLQSKPSKQTLNALKAYAFNEPLLSLEEMSK